VFAAHRAHTADGRARNSSLLQQFEFLQDYFSKTYKIRLETEKTSLRGHNWGEAKVNGEAAEARPQPVVISTRQPGNVFEFRVSTERAFEIPLSVVANCQQQTGVRGNKNELSIELEQNDATSLNADSLVELRLYVPPRGKRSVRIAADADDEENVLDGGDKQHDGEAALKLAADIQAHAHGVRASEQRAIATFRGIPVITPRNKYDIEFLATSFQMLAAARSFKVAYEHVTRLTMLPKVSDAVLCPK
jgi:structure-specific recognition protein 1